MGPLKIPRIDREEINLLTPEEANRLLEAACDDRLEALYVLAIHTGLRQGELLAFKWKDVDLERSVLRVSRTLTRTGGVFVPGEAKTKMSPKCYKPRI
jgi:integrase